MLDDSEVTQDHALQAHVLRFLTVAINAVKLNVLGHLVDNLSVLNHK